jgi:hypothetical protein
MTAPGMGSFSGTASWRITFKGYLGIAGVIATIEQTQEGKYVMQKAE